MLNKHTANFSRLALLNIINNSGEFSAESCITTSLGDTDIRFNKIPMPEKYKELEAAGAYALSATRHSIESGRGICDIKLELVVCKAQNIACGYSLVHRTHLGDVAHLSAGTSLDNAMTTFLNQIMAHGQPQWTIDHPHVSSYLVQHVPPFRTNVFDKEAV